MRKRRSGPSSTPGTPSLPASDPVAAPTSWSMLSRSLTDTERLGHLIGTALQGGEVLALYGEVGTGKTALVRGIAAGLGAAPRSVSSPTFVLIHEYQGRLRLAHADLYRLESAETLPHLGLEEYIDGRTVVAVEWAERAQSELPRDRVEIWFAHHSPNERTIAIVGIGNRSRQTLAHIFDQAQRVQGAKALPGIASPPPPRETST